MLNQKIFFEYKIDNYSSLIPKKELDKYLDNNKIGIYFLYDKNKKIIYIGRSFNCIKSRLFLHLQKKPPVYIKEKELKKILLLRIKSKYFGFIFVKNDKFTVQFIEQYLINKFKPKYNKEYKYEH
jgi:excinuclease UvrABC nuclease subunit